MCDAIRIAHPQIASDAKKFFASDAKTHSLDLNSQENARKKSLRKSCNVGLRCEKSGCFLRSSDAKCLRFGLPLRFGLRCEHPRSQISSDVGRAMRATKNKTNRHKEVWRNTSILGLQPSCGRVLFLPEPQNSQSDYFSCLTLSGRRFFFPLLVWWNLSGGAGPVAIRLIYAFVLWGNYYQTNLVWEK